MYDDTPGWEIWIPESLLNVRDVEKMYEHLIQVPVKAFHYLGVRDAKFRPKNDIEVRGRKISGTGIYVNSGGILFCGTVLLDLDVELMLKVLKLPIEKISDKAIKSFEERVTTVKREVGYKPSISEVVEVFKKAVKDVFGAELFEGDLNEWEKEELSKVVVRYMDRSWVYELRKGAGFTRVCTYKTPGGLLRVHVKVFENVVEQLLLTGDFFAYPQTSVQEIEAKLKWVPVEDVRDEILRFSEHGDVTILGLTLNDLALLVWRCVKGN